MSLPYDLKPYKLTLPVNEDKKPEGRAFELFDMDDIVAYLLPKDANTLSFICPDGGATTPSAKYARCELRDLREFTSKTRKSDKLCFSVEALPDGHKTVVCQIHDREAPWFKVAVNREGDRLILRALYKRMEGEGSDFAVPLRSDLRIGQKVWLTSDYVPATPDADAYLKWKVDTRDGAPVVIKRSKIQRTGRYDPAYFKRGNYYQTRARAGNVCIVDHHKFTNS